MTEDIRQGVGKGISQERAKQAIDLLLEDKSDEFKAVVFEMCRQMDWPDDDPSFLFAIATNQLEALVRQYPERISEAMALAAAQLEKDWMQIQTQLSLAAIQNNQILSRMTQQLTNAHLAIDQELSRTQHLLTEERRAMLQVMAQERDQVRRLLADERAAITQQAKELTEHQKQVIDAHTSELITQAALTWRERADAHVKLLIKEVRAQRYWRLVTFACIAILLVFATGWIGGALSNSRAQAASTWGDLERWNQNEVDACVAANKTTCNIHIVVPKEPAE